MQCIRCSAPFVSRPNTPNRKFCTPNCQSYHWSETHPGSRRKAAIDYYHRRRSERGPAPRTEAKAASDREWQRRNRDRVAARNSRWKRANPATVVAQSNRRRSKTVGSYTAEEWSAIPFNDRCSYCGGVGQMQVEHVVPISSGGSNTIENIVPACRSCNGSKGNKSLVFYLAQRSN